MKTYYVTVTRDGETLHRDAPHIATSVDSAYEAGLAAAVAKLAFGGRLPADGVLTLTVRVSERPWTEAAVE